VLEVPPFVFARKLLLISCARARIVSQQSNIKYYKVIDLSNLQPMSLSRVEKFVLASFCVNRESNSNINKKLGLIGQHAFFVNIKYLAHTIS